MGNKFLSVNYAPSPHSPRKNAVKSIAGGRSTMRFCEVTPFNKDILITLAGPPARWLFVNPFTRREWKWGKGEPLSNPIGLEAAERKGLIKIIYYGNNQGEVFLTGFGYWLACALKVNALAECIAFSLREC
ncbi:hypothetical protein CCP3SC15_1210007 [Gammaproteobacteria bacterium]